MSTSGARTRLQVRVNRELVLDAGTLEEVAGVNGPARLIRPPSVTLYRQLLAYLDAKPIPRSVRGARWRPAKA